MPMLKDSSSLHRALLPPNDGGVSGAVAPVDGGASCEDGAAAHQVLLAEVEEVGRVCVYRVSGPFLSYQMIFSTPDAPALGAPRPETLPPSIDKFLWGHLSIAVEDALAPIVFKGAMTSFWFIFLSFFLVSGVLALYFFPSVGTSSWINAAAALGLIVLVLAAILGVVLGLFNGPLIRSAPAAVERGLRKSAPHFRNASYDLCLEVVRLTGHRCWSWCWDRQDAYVRIVRVHRADADDGGAWDNGEPSFDNRPTRRSDDGELSSFRVMVCRPRLRRTPQWCPCLEPKAVGAGVSNGELTFAFLRDPVASNLVDDGTWGAVATELRPLTREYFQVRCNSPLERGISLLPVAIILLEALLSLDQYIGIWGYALLLVASYGLILGCPIPEKWLGLARFDELHRQCDAKVRDLAPGVADRTGFELSYEIETDFWGNRWGYVHFRRNTTPSSSSLPEPV